MISRRLLGTLALGAAAMIQCSSSSNPAGPGSYSPGLGYVKGMEMSYTLSGANQITTIQTHNQCNGSVLASVSDTSIGVYFVTAESLLVIDTSGGKTDTSTKSRRTSSGTGLSGTWREYQYDSSIGMNVEVLYVISATSIQGWVQKTSLISIFKAELLASGSSGTALSGLTIDTSAADRIQFTGKTTHEVVTLTIADNGAFRWSSTNPSHATQDINIFAGPTTCPDNGMGSIPNWYVEFAMANPPLAKLRALPQPHLTLRIFGR